MSKKSLSLVLILFFILSIAVIKTGAAAPRLTKTKKHGKDITHKIGTGIRFHRDNVAFEDLPFREGDLSYLLYYEYHEGIGYWQIGLGYTPSLDEFNSIEKVITPQLSLVIKDRIYRAGIGILKSYITDNNKDKNTKFEDTDLYYQFILGLSFPVKRLSLDINGLYSFENWKDMDFKLEDIEYSATVSLTF